MQILGVPVKTLLTLNPLTSYVGVSAIAALLPASCRRPDPLVDRARPVAADAGHRLQRLPGVRPRRHRGAVMTDRDRRPSRGAMKSRHRTQRRQRLEGLPGATGQAGEPQGAAPRWSPHPARGVLGAPRRLARHQAGLHVRRYRPQRLGQVDAAEADGQHPPPDQRLDRGSSGRISALLELGTGFHPELSGRENIYLNASILGINKAEIDRRLDDIIDFAGIGEFIDSPVRIYSSGMKVRLGFSVAVHVDPEILLLDEVIAVGDERFKRMCFEHMYTLRQSGCHHRPRHPLHGPGADHVRRGDLAGEGRGARPGRCGRGRQPVPPGGQRPRRPDRRGGRRPAPS